MPRVPLWLLVVLPPSGWPRLSWEHLWQARSARGNDGNDWWFFSFLQRRGPIDKFLGISPSGIHDFPVASLFPPFQSLLWSPFSLIIPNFESDCVWLERGSEKLTFWALAFLSSDSEKLWTAGCVRSIYQEMEVCYAGNVVRWKTRINSLNKKRSLFLARRVIKGLRFCLLLWWRIELQIPMFSLGYLARLKWIARVSIGLGRSFNISEMFAPF